MRIGIEPRTVNDVVFCFDVDDTLINGNSHNYIGNKLFQKYGNVTQEGRESEIIEYMQEFLADPTKGWKNKKETEKLMDKIFEADYKIALVTHNIFRGAIEYLVEQLDLYLEDKNKILIVSGDLLNRCEQINQVKEYFKIEKFENIVLIDDNRDNIIVAKENGVVTVIVNNIGTEYLEYTNKLLRNFINPDEVSTEILSSDDSNENNFETNVADEGYCSDGEYTLWESEQVLGDNYNL